MTRTVLALAAAVVLLSGAVGFTQVEAATARGGGGPPVLAQATPDAEPSEAQPAQDSNDGGDEGGVPIWAGIGLILLAAVAGSSLARRRNRRRIERHE